MRMPEEAHPAPLSLGVDYTVDASGRWVFTERHLKSRGYCCFNACRECPWGQAGRTPAQAFVDLQRRLDEVEHALADQGLEVDVTGYRLGVLYVRPPPTACATDLEGLSRIIRESAQPQLTVSQVAWA